MFNETPIQRDGDDITEMQFPQTAGNLDIEGFSDNYT